MTHFVGYRLRVEDGVRYSKVYARRKDDPKIVWHKDSTWSWRDAVQLEEETGCPAPRMKVADACYSISKEKAEERRGQVEQMFRDQNFVTE